MDVAQLYMLALRPTMTPILGESCDNLFLGQIEVEGWTWKFHNQEVKSDRETDESVFDEGKSALEEKRSTNAGLAAQKQFKRIEKELEFDAAKDSMADAQKLVDEMIRSGNTNNERFKELSAKIATAAVSLGSSEDSIKEAVSKAEKEWKTARYDANAKSLALTDRNSKIERERRHKLERERRRAADAQRDPNFEFTFTKRIDVSTTQLLNCMKAGDLLPTVVLTMHQASSNTPWTLVITVTKVRLLDYKMKVEVSDTMSDMREEWTCEFASFGYVYQNRPHAGVKSLTSGGAAQTAAKAATQGTVRTFMMKNPEFW
jgi:type VI protein secretion system component Hcp